MRKKIGISVFGALALSGCSAGNGSPSPTETALKAELAAAERWRAIDTVPKFDAEVLDVSASERTIVRSMMRESGIDAELGGTARAEAELNELSAQFRRNLLGQAASIPRFIKAADGGDPVGYLGAGMVVGAGMFVTKGIGDMASNDSATGALYPPTNNTGIQPEADTLSTSTLDGTLSLGEAVVTSTFEGATEGLTGRVTSKMKFDLCPKADGTIHFELQAQATLTSKSGKTVSSKSEVEVTRTVNDDAEYTGQMDRTARVEHAVYGGASAGTFVDLTDALLTSNNTMGETVNRKSSKASDADVRAASDMAKLMTLIGHAAGFAAEKAFKSGRCVTLNPTSDPAKRSGVKPKTSFALLAAPRSKIDGTPTGGSVTATLTGEGALDPAGTKVAADAKFTHVAPDAKNKKGTVAFGARSKRGIGKASLDFDTMDRAYAIDGGGGQFRGKGKTCNLAEPFTVRGNAGIVVEFKPKSERGGSYDYTGQIAGCRLYGSGSYSVGYNGDTPVSISGSGPGSAACPMGTNTRNGAEKYTLTPLVGEGCN